MAPPTGWQAAYPVVSKFIAYSGEPLKSDSLLVYYRINDGEYRVAHMSATGNPDEYVGYITGYQSNDSIDYYVFGADESGHRYTQPVFAELDPHHFTVGEYNPSGELVITPDTLWFEQMGQGRSFTIFNETADEVTIQEINPEAGAALNIWEPNLPVTLQPNESVTVMVDLQYAPLKDEYLNYVIEVNTTAGTYIVTAMVLDEAYDMGLYIPGAPVVELTVNEPQAIPYAVNGNYGTNTPIEVTAVYETDNNSYLELIHHDLPYTLQVGEYFEIIMKPANFVGKGQVYTEVVLESNDGTMRWAVSIDEDLVSVTELSAETKLYPNPTSGNFTVEGANVAKVEVYNLVGQKVFETENGERRTENYIDATNWNKGIYLVSIIDQNGAVETKKLVVK